MIQVKTILEKFLKYQIDFIYLIEKFNKLNQIQILLCNNLINKYKEMDKKRI